MEEVMSNELRADHARPKKAADRLCRVDIRLTIAERKKLERNAKATRRTITSVLVELIEKLK